MKKFTGHYTKDTAKAIKAAERLICTTTEDGAIYLCSGYWMYKMDALEYAAVAQPVTHCDPGNWTIDSNGKRDGNDGKNLLQIFADAVKANESKPALERCPLSLERPNLSAYLYHSPDGFAAAYDCRYIAPISKGQQLRAPGATSPAVFYDSEKEPFALVMPIRLDAKDIRAITAYFTEPAEQKASDSAAQVDRLRDKLTQAQDENAQQAAELEALRAKLAELEAQQAPAQEAADDKPQQAPAHDAKTAAELIASRFAGFAGVTATIKGAQTAAPVVWLAGDTEKHADAIKAAGAKWSNKKSAFYVRVA